MLLAFWVVVMLGMTGWGLIGSLRAANPAAACVLLGVLLTLAGFTLGVTMTGFGWIETCAHQDDLGTTVALDRRVGRVVLASTIVMIPTAIGFLIFLYTGDIVIQQTRRGGPASMALAAVLAIVGGVVLIVSYPKRALGRVVLSPRGFHVVEGGREFRGAWADVRGVTSEGPSERKRAAGLQRPIVLDMDDGSVHVIGNANSYVPGGAALYWMVRYYWRHPERRDELVDGTALSRLREQRIPTD